MGFWGAIILFIVFNILFPRRRQGNMMRRFIMGEYADVLDDASEINFGNTLQDVRDTYSVALETWVKTHKIQNHLQNDFCELSLYHTEKFEDKPDDLCFYCKEHSKNRKAGKLFSIKGNNEHTSTMWAIINMEFNKTTTYNDIKKLYMTLNNGIGVQGSLVYFKENVFSPYPEFVVNKWAQNEFCRMEIREYNGNKVMYCYDIWNNSNHFYISGNKLILYAILGEFAKNKNKMENFSDLYKKYSKRNDCTVSKEPVSVQNRQPEATNQHIFQDQSSVKTEPETDIKKYDERNLDL